MHIDAVTLAGLVSVGLGIGLMAGFFGVGGGFLLTPLLNVLFGLPYNLAVGSNIVQVSVMSWSNMRQHMRLGHVDLKLGCALLAGSFFGAETGVRIQKSLRTIGDLTFGENIVSGYDLSMAGLFFVFLTLMGVSVLVETSRTLRRKAAEARTEPSAGEQAAASEAPHPEPGREPQNEGTRRDGGEPSPSSFSRRLLSLRWWPCFSPSSDPTRRISLWVPLTIGYGASILMGLLGIGGVVTMPLMIYVLGMPTLIGVGTAAFLSTVVAIYSGIRYIMLGMVVWPVVGALLAGSLVGVRVGAHFSGRIPADRLRRAFAYTVLGSAGVVTLDALRRMFGS